MTFERYTEINRLADRIVERGDDNLPEKDELMVRSLKDRERRVLNDMIFKCERCATWRDSRDLSTMEPRHKAARICAHCRQLA